MDGFPHCVRWLGACEERGGFGFAATPREEKEETGGSPDPLSRRMAVRVGRGLNRQGAEVAEGRKAGTTG